MELVVGTNCYFDIAEADEIINDRFSSFDPINKFWNSIENDNDKKAIILSAIDKYDRDNLNYIGVKVDSEQTLEFPRLVNDVVVECPDLIKIGLLIQGVKDVMSLSNEESELRNSGVKSFADGSGAKIEFDTEHSIKNNNGIYNDVFDKYFKEYTEFGRYITI